MCVCTCMYEREREGKNETWKIEVFLTNTLKIEGIFMDKVLAMPVLKYIFFYLCSPSDYTAHGLICSIILSGTASFPSLNTRSFLIRKFLQNMKVGELKEKCSSSVSISRLLSCFS